MLGVGAGTVVVGGGPTIAQPASNIAATLAKQANISRKGRNDIPDASISIERRRSVSE